MKKTYFYVSLVILQTLAWTSDFSIPTNNCPANYAGFFEPSTSSVQSSGNYNIQVFSQNFNTYNWYNHSYWSSDLSYFDDFTITDYIVDEPFIYYLSFDYNEYIDLFVTSLTKANMLTGIQVWSWEWVWEYFNTGGWDERFWEFGAIVLSPSKKYILVPINDDYCDCTSLKLINERTGATVVQFESDFWDGGSDHQVMKASFSPNEAQIFM